MPGFRNDSVGEIKIDTKSTIVSTPKLNFSAIEKMNLNNDKANSSGSNEIVSLDFSEIMPKEDTVTHQDASVNKDEYSEKEVNVEYNKERNFDYQIEDNIEYESGDKVEKRTITSDRTGSINDTVTNTYTYTGPNN